MLSQMKRLRIEEAGGRTGSLDRGSTPLKSLTPARGSSRLQSTAKGRTTSCPVRLSVTVTDTTSCVTLTETVCQRLSSSGCEMALIGVQEGWGVGANTDPAAASEPLPPAVGVPSSASESEARLISSCSVSGTRDSRGTSLCPTRASHEPLANQQEELPPTPWSSTVRAVCTPVRNKSRV
jgi:hypothetical protein